MTLIAVEKSYKYDVAFSFLAKDESLAYQINDLIQDRISTFIYSKHQEDIVGRDGIEVFGKVFREEARVAVILYREGWGTTKFTRVEETAIKERATEESPDFTICISLDKTKPKWLSRNQIWYDLQTFGVQGTAAVIAKKVNEYGGEIREETIQDQAARFKRANQRTARLENYFRTAEALHDAKIEVNKTLEKAKQNIIDITDHANGLSFGKNEEEGKFYTCFGSGLGLTFLWNQVYSDSPVDSYLHIYLANSDYYDTFSRHHGQVYKEARYKFYLNEADAKGWLPLDGKGDFKTSDQLVQEWQKVFLDRGRKIQMERKRQTDQY